MLELREKIRSLEGASYKQYKMLQGVYTFPGFVLSIDHVQGDPFAKPSRISLHLDHETAGFPRHLWSNPDRKRACEDYLARTVDRLLQETISATAGSGRSGEVRISCNGQPVLKRNCLLFDEDHLEARITVGLPADGRRVLAAEAEHILCDELPKVVEGALVYDALPASEIEAHVYSIEDQAELRRSLQANRLVAFVANDSILPRRSGIDEHPLEGELVPVRAPDSLAIDIELPNGGSVRGLGIPEGVTLIIGGGFHGKSTLLHAIERGVYDHVPGDGRERVVTVADAVKVRAEDGRSVSCLDISGFIDNLPLGRDTRSFSTANASGSTSQAANIIEALHAGASLLLIDEDTSATNFMIRDAIMRQLVEDDKEPITPFLYRVRELYDRFGISSVIVMGGSDDYLSVADTVIMMDSYEIRNVTEQAHELASAQAPVTPGKPLSFRSSRKPKRASLDATRNHKIRVEARNTRELVYGQHEVDVSKLEQLVDSAQLETIGWMLHRYAEEGDDQLCASDAMAELYKKLEAIGLDSFSPYARMGNLAEPRLQELVATLNRVREIDWTE